MVTVGIASGPLSSALAEALSATAIPGIVWQAVSITASDSIEHLDILFMNHPLNSQQPASADGILVMEPENHRI
jgi:hypothetical protein